MRCFSWLGIIINKQQRDIYHACNTFVESYFNERKRISRPTSTSTHKTSTNSTYQIKLNFRPWLDMECKLNEGILVAWEFQHIFCSMDIYSPASMVTWVLEVEGELLTWSHHGQSVHYYPMWLLCSVCVNWTKTWTPRLSNWDGSSCNVSLMQNNVHIYGHTFHFNFS